MTYGEYANAAAEFMLVTGHDATLYVTDEFICCTSLSDAIKQADRSILTRQ